jgi:Protein of unknown function (DUF3072)
MTNARSPKRHQQHNPKLEAVPPSNTEKDPEDWVSGADPMTGAQASYLKTLAEECNEGRTSKRIDTLKAKRGQVTHR